MPSCCLLARRCLPLLLLSLTLLGLSACGPRPVAVVPRPPEEPLPIEPGPVHLAVLVVFDQLRGDYLTRWDDLFGDGGFHRLEHDGAWFPDCHYPYAGTVTGPGHSSLTTGCLPAKHGIIGNEWFDRDTATEAYCVGSERYQRVPPDPNPDKKKVKGFSPGRLLVPGLGDALKTATGGRGRVVSLSMKDRASVLPGGHHADACYWFDPDSGDFVTSAYYRDALHPWVSEVNAGRLSDGWFGQKWERLRPELDYTPRSSADDAPGEGKGSGQNQAFQGQTFPHPMSVSGSRPGKEYYQALYNSPFGNELLLDLVKRAVEGEELGRRDVPDLLCVSFSCNDPIGHCWGPDSQEVLDTTLRSDQVVQQLLTFLDARVGKGRYVLVLSADHGVCPLPEATQAKGKQAFRVAPDQLGKQVEAFLDTAFGAGEGKARWLEAPPALGLYLNRQTLRQHGLQQSVVEDALAAWLAKQPGIQAAYTRSRLQRGVPDNDTVGQAVLKSFHPDRSGDVIVVMKPYHVLQPYLTGTGHGTPHPYDTHVPLLVYGPGVRPGKHPEAVTPLAAAAILAHGLHLPPPAAAEEEVPAGLFTAE
jgi:predicted AlkP superfamily pyrophosphatase or phosphodiesterase